MPAPVGDLEGSLAVLAATLARASEAGQWATVERLSEVVAKLTEELRVRRLDGAGNVVAIDRKRSPR